MRLKDDHMRNAQLKPAYNVQISVEAEYITGVGVFQDRNDTTTLIPLLESMEENLGRRYENMMRAMRVKKITLTSRVRALRATSSHNLMSAARRGASRKISVSARICSMTRSWMSIPATIRKS